MKHYSLVTNTKQSVSSGYGIGKGLYLIQCDDGDYPDRKTPVVLTRRELEGFVSRLQMLLDQSPKRWDDKGEANETSN